MENETYKTKVWHGHWPWKAVTIATLALLANSMTTSETSFHSKYVKDLSMPETISHDEKPWQLLQEASLFIILDIAKYDPYSRIVFSCDVFSCSKVPSCPIWPCVQLSEAKGAVQRQERSQDGACTTASPVLAASSRTWKEKVDSVPAIPVLRTRWLSGLSNINKVSWARKENVHHDCTYKSLTARHACANHVTRTHKKRTCSHTYDVRLPESGTMRMVNEQANSRNVDAKNNKGEDTDRTTSQAHL